MAKLRNILLICLTAVGVLTAERSYSDSGLTAEGGHEVPFRGAWIATVANIDWPSPEAIGNTHLQQSEMLFLLDSLQALGINAVIFQVRPTADALYYSELEPVSHWLTGK